MSNDFVPALGNPKFTQFYDLAIALMTRERKWRPEFVQLIDPQDGEVLIDVGSGTGSLAIALKCQAPSLRVIGVDPDPVVLQLARGKAEARNQSIEWFEEMGDAISSVLGPIRADKIVSSLVLHQCLPDMKLRILDAMHKASKPGGQLFLADYGLQRTALMRVLFRQVQNLDGWECTTPNAKGELPSMIASAGFRNVREVRVTQTLTGSISFFHAIA
jgi:ubiquinone/menaquinone biosynthesis C-methylase UbiE